MRSFRKGYVPLLIAVLIAGCGDAKEGAAAGGKTATQVAARVNGTELTVHQVNYALQRIPNLGSEQSKPASMQVLRNLVDQEMLVQKAQADKLDRDPAVVQALDAARRQILADAWMGRRLGIPAAPPDVEVSDYYNQHPELFSNRKVYRLQEISIKAPKDKHDAIRAQMGASRTLNDFGAWLKTQNLPAKAAQGVKPAEQLPLALLPQLAKMSDGQAMVVNAPDGLLVIALAGSRPQPVTLEQARPAITRLLQTQARQKTAKAELDALRAASRIEYVGDFVDAGKNAPAPVVAAPTKKAIPDADADAIGKGISGLN
ncbi:MAG: EpsD family peptidyl-prolyl cis-trans isomerase [Gammaproteobacteria bacterium]